MKKQTQLFLGMMALQLIYPICLLFAWALNADFTFYSQLAYEIVTTVLFVTAATLRCGKDAPPTRWDWLLLLAVLINGAWLISADGTLSFLFMVVNLLCVIVLLCRHKSWKKILVVFLICIPATYKALCFGVISYVFDGWAEATLVSQIESPSGTYTAYISLESAWLEDKHDYRVEVAKNSRVWLLFGEFTPKAERLHIGLIREDEPLQVEWVDEDTVSVNGMLYDIG